jgi:uncharacterized protein (DUF427 family)
MLERTIKVPGPEHPISIEKTSGRVIVKFNGHVLADTLDALTVREAKYPEILYIPREDADMKRLNRSEHSTYCPFKGDCAYYNLDGGSFRNGGPLNNAVWTYEAPFAAVESIRDHLAFYPDRFEIIRAS